MYTSSKIRFLRFMGLTFVGALFPVFGWGVWQLLQFLSYTISPAVYIIISFSLAGVVVVLLLGSSLAKVIPSKKDEEIAYLMRSHKESLTLYEHSPIPYLTLDQAGNIKMQNLSAVRLFDTTTEGLLGMSAAQLFIKTEGSDPTTLQSAILEHRAISDVEVQIKISRGELRWVKATLLTFRDGRENLLALVDITKAKEVDAAKSEFVALATHQLRTPLAAIRWNTELLEQTLSSELSSGGKKYLSKLKRNVIRMGDLINDFLSASQLEMGTFSTSQELIDLPNFFNTVVGEFESQIKNNGLNVTTSYEPEQATMVSDPRLLHIIVSNLTSNAVKYTPNNGAVHVAYKVANHEIIITIADSGIGVPEAEQTSLFSKFFRAVNARDKQAEGTGLGLYVVEQSVKKLHGRIEFNSIENEGTTFVVHLPYQSK